MSTLAYLIDTNILIELEGEQPVRPAYSKFASSCLRYGAKMFAHEAALEDFARDRDSDRRTRSLSKLSKYEILPGTIGLDETELSESFGRIRSGNDLVDCKLLHAVSLGAADFLVTEDNGIHARARSHSSELGERVLRVVDALEHVETALGEPKASLRYIKDRLPHEIPLSDPIFESLREGYPEFDTWWKEKCVKQRRPCWTIEDSTGIAALVVRKNERHSDSEVSLPGERVLKICTFKVRPESRGVKLGELLLKKILWSAQLAQDDTVYLTTYPDQASLIDLLEHYGFQATSERPDGELIYERNVLHSPTLVDVREDAYDFCRKSYPLYLTDDSVRAFVVPIKEAYHDLLFPDIRADPRQTDLFAPDSAGTPLTPGNTIRKVYICRTNTALGPAGSILFFYKGDSKESPSKSITAVGILESSSTAKSTKRLVQLTGGRSVYSEKDLENEEATFDRPVKVINFLHVEYLENPISLDEATASGMLASHPQSTQTIHSDQLERLLNRAALRFSV